MSVKILVIEDDLYIQELIKEFLKAQDYHVEVATDGMEGYQKFQQGVFDLVLLDIMLPNMDGYSVCRMIRSHHSTPVIFLTALSDENDQLKAFELEADDFISKPFSFNVLVKRVEAVLRRSLPETKPNELQFDRLRMDCESYKAYIDQTVIELTVKEFEILQFFVENSGRTITREMLLDKLWGYNFYGDTRIVDAHIKNIRKKLGLPYIRTLKGIGYIMDGVTT
ncbi:response regulator transcription factor [Paenibacillus sp. GM2]|uniref:response regulator transcription factor n=1 Tax=Paenibacillus sp. GM2 TaxID=1622070 RepID=UPI000837E85C|nr:response regulator transcription factor [Paenibacillus sp. GM2]